MGDPGAGVRCLRFLASLPVLPRYITLFIAILIGTVIRPVVDWLYRQGFSPHDRGYSGLLSGAYPADRFYFVVISVTDQPGYNDRRR